MRCKFLDINPATSKLYASNKAKNLAYGNGYCPSIE